MKNPINRLLGKLKAKSKYENNAVDIGMNKFAKAITRSGCKFSTDIVCWEHYKTLSRVGKDLVGRHYGEWVQKIKTMGLMEAEYLVPRIIVPYSTEKPSAMAIAEEAFQKNPERIKDFKQYNWGYYYYLGGGFSTLGTEASLAGSQILSKFRSLHRIRMIVKGVEAIMGPFNQVTFLDMACNWGAFSIELAASGASNVTGVDLRTENIEKAQMLMDYLGVTGASFQEMNVYDIPEDNQYDVVLNLGLLYHVTKQYELVKKTFDLTRKIGVIETITHKEPFSGFILGSGVNISHQHAAGEISAELHPTYRALIDMMYMVGFKTVIEIEAEPDPNWQNYSSDVFGKKLRRCLVGIK